MTAVVSNKTIITEDPITNEANDLKNYANTHLTGLSTILNINIPNCNLYLLTYIYDYSYKTTKCNNSFEGKFEWLYIVDTIVDFLYNFLHNIQAYSFCFLGINKLKLDCITL